MHEATGTTPKEVPTKEQFYMRTFKLIGALVVVLAFSAVAVASASAAEILWKWLPGSAGETFSGKSGKATLKGKFGSITCTKSTTALATASLLEEGATGGKDATLALAIIKFEGCAAFGLPANSTDEASGSGLIRTHVEIHNCLIKPNDFGVLIKPLQVHIEVPAVKLLILVRGDVIALVEGTEGTKATTFGLNVKTVKKEGKVQEFTECEKGELKEELEAAHDGETFEPATEEALEGSITFDKAKDAAGEEPMEK